jgi:crotonobetainyl-CoA:carnitine CoA-transferase CaiB-like acyl-CoA transferase
MTQRLTEATKRFSKADLLAACEGQGVPAGPINDMKEVFDDPQIQHRGMQMSIDGVPSVRAPLFFSGAELSMDQPSPKLDEHGDAIRAEVGAGVKNG